MTVELKPPLEQAIHVRTHEGSPYRGALWILLAVAVAAGLNALLPLVAARVPFRYEKSAFQAIPLYREDQICRADPAASEGLAQVLARIYPLEEHDQDFSIDLSVVRKKEVNAFAFLGGRIFVFQGLLEQAQSPEELAAIVAHEIEHVKRRHIIYGLIRKALGYSLEKLIVPGADLAVASHFLGAASMLKFDRTQEEQADQGALERLHAARVSAAGFKAFFSRKNRSKGAAGTSLGELSSPFSDHPSDLSRAQKADAYLAYESTPVLSENTWRALRQICAH